MTTVQEQAREQARDAGKAAIRVFLDSSGAVDLLDCFADAFLEDGWIPPREAEKVERLLRGIGGMAADPTDNPYMRLHQIAEIITNLFAAEVVA